MFFEAHPLPVAGAVRKGETGLTRKADHDVVGAQRISEKTFGAKRGGAAFQIPEQCRTAALALPAVVDRQAELETCRVAVERVAGFANDGFNAIDRHRRNHAEAVALANMDEMIEFGLRTLAHGAEKAIVAGADRERPEVTLQRACVPRLHKAHRQRLAGTQPQDIGMLPEGIETKRNHCGLPLFPKSR